MIFQCGLAVRSLDLFSSRILGNAQDRVRFNSRRLFVRECFCTRRHCANYCEKILKVKVVRICGVGKL
jgi:hypothetical protein